MAPEPKRAFGAYTSVEKRPMLREAEIAALLRYMKSSPRVGIYPGFFKDEVTGAVVQEDWLVYADGEYEWSSKDIYHIERYGLSPDAGLLEKAIVSVGTR